MRRTLAAMTCAMLCLPGIAAANQTTVTTVVGYVDSVEVLTSSYIRKTPAEEKVCGVEEVPIYAGQEEDSGIGGLIIGGLIGSAVGNAASDKDGAGTFGAVTGALIGHDQAKKNSKKGKIVGYKQQDVCTIRQVVREERIEEISGYRLKISVDGEHLTLKSSRSYNAGDSISIRKQTTYSIN
ncbi:hypothetical protein AB8880_08850 [Alphaproteobacteria bacterium LSUCC0684]